MKEIKSIDKKSLAKIVALIYGLVGFIMALIVVIFSIPSVITQKNFQGSVTLAALYNIGVGLLIGVLAAILTAFWGWVIGYITAAIYNWFSGKVGGIKVELADVAEEKKEEARNQQSM